MNALFTPGRFVAPRKPPTARQLQVLRIVAEWVVSRGFPPTLKEICERMGISSTNGANDHLRCLEKRQLIERIDMDARSVRITEAGWEVLGVEPGHCPHCGNPKRIQEGTA